MFGAVVMVFLVIFNVYRIMAVPLYMGPQVFLFISVTYLISISVGWLGSVLIGIGFLGLSVKYDEPLARYVLYAYIVGTLASMANEGLSLLTPSSQASQVLLTGTGLLDSAASIVVLPLVILSLWKIRRKSNHIQTLNLLVASYCADVLSIPLLVLLAAFLGSTALLVWSYALALLIGTTMLVLFHLESRVDVSHFEGAAIS